MSQRILNRFIANIIFTIMVPPGPISAALFYAIMMVESGGDLNAVGDGNRAIGPFQVHYGYWIDASQFDRSLTSNGQTYQNCRGPGSLDYSERVMQAYMSRYATRRLLGHEPTDQDMARIHNGGPDGYKNKNTLGYWQKVRQYLRVATASSRSYWRQILRSF